MSALPVMFNIFLERTLKDNHNSSSICGRPFSNLTSWVAPSVNAKTSPTRSKKREHI
ncbi:hypothetical protein DPMN_007136 [Dreissena polymorpha]|uniref:Uncharacterized protein n=1 Tax=Dreissena polymorpha TaxID=45954 RepID=A0A9D4RY40_DREPO|nr:hypothetical protein DPMN_007136 [Dreissena polymorpha]